MCDSLTKAVEVVRKAEGELRELIQSAVDTGAYDRVAVLARWAEQLSQIGVNSANSVNIGKPSGVGAHRSNGTTLPKTTTRTKAKQRKSKYPKFERSGDNLVKVAWSKASKTEYVHQTSKANIYALIEKIQHTMSDDTLITMDEVLPLVTSDHSELPSYQSYACLAWLRAIGVVEQHGRRGYSILSEQNVKKLIEEAWSNLPIHRS